MKYKYIRLRIIIPSIIVVLLIIFVCSYFFTGLSDKNAIALDNIEWDSSNFLQLNPEMIKTEDKEQEVWKIDGRDLNKAALVGSNEKYALVIDEDTTIVSLYKKNEGWTETDPTANATFLYSSANKDGKGEEISNIVLYYYDSNGKLSSGMTSYDKSVKYTDTLQGKDIKHYSLRYNDDGSVDILYAIGDFMNINELFPKYYDRADFEEIFIGNTILGYQYDSDIKELTPVYDKETGEIVKTVDAETGEEKNKDVVELHYLNYGYCFDNEVALYILQNNLGTLTFKSYSTAIKDKVFTEVPEDTTEILDCTMGYWLLSNIFDEEGKHKFINGVNYNCGSSPIRINPFLTDRFLGNIFSNTFYPLKEKEVKTINDKEETINFETNYLLHISEEQADAVNAETGKSTVKYSSSCLEFKGYQTNNAIELINYLRVGNFRINEKGYAIYAEHQYDNGRANTGFVQPTYLDYNQDGKIDTSEAFIYGGYQGRDDAGNYLFIDENEVVFYFDASGNKMINVDGVPTSVDSTLPYKPFQQALTTEMTQKQNVDFGEASASETKAFELCLRFSLEEYGVKVSLIHDSIIEGLGKENNDPNVASYLKHDNLIGKVEICKFMTTNSNAEEVGQMIIPDGSGAIINFNSDKVQQYTAKYPEQRIYGKDNSIVRQMMGADVKNIMFGMYGFIEQTSKKGVVVIADEAAGQTSISADSMRNTSSSTSTSGGGKYNTVFFTSYLREKEEVSITTESTYVKVSEKIYPGDVIYSYHIMDDDKLTYVEVANIYRDYLIKKYELEENDTTKVATPTISFIGAYEKKSIALGFVYEAERSLTTFKQASTIIDDLTNKGIKSMNVSYQLWTDDEMHQPTTTDVDVSSVLSGKNDLEELADKLKQNGLNFFLDYRVTTGIGYDLFLGTLKYNSKSISGARSSSLQYILSTGAADKTARSGNFISPIFYKSLLQEYAKEYNKLKVSGIYLSDLGNKSVADYTKSRQIYTAVGSLYQSDAITYASENIGLVMLDEPFDYSFKGLDVANNVPVTATLYPIVDYSIPLYELVVSGLFDYSSQEVNYNNDNSINWNLLKAIETGSNLAFYVSAEDTNVLLDTSYTRYYNSYYSNWRENIIQMNKTLEDTGIYESRLVSHEFLSDTVVKVKYQNGLEIIINYSPDTYSDPVSGLAIRGNWYAIMKKGEN